MSADPDKFTNITLLLRLSIILNQDRLTYRSRTQVGRSSEDIFWGGLAGILGVKDDVIAIYVPESGTVVVAAQSETDLDTPCSMAPRYPPDIVVVPNPKGHRNAKKRTSNPHQLRLLEVDNATDFWPQVKTNEWCCANTPVTLEQHAKTVASYLNDYKSASGALQVGHARCFFSYLVTVCWERTFSRISSWSAVGFIYGLRTVLRNGDVDTAIKRFPWKSLDEERRPGDRTLVHTLKDASMEAIPVMMATLDTKYQSVDQLISAVETAVTGDGDYRIYTESTARQFHCLLLAAFLKFAKVLNEINIARRKKAGTDELVTIFRSFAIWARILTCILASPSFEDHLRVLMHSKKLSIVVPVFAYRETYESFAMQQRMRINTRLGSSVDDSDMPQDLDYLNRRTPLTPLLRWLRNLVIHFLAKRSLQAHYVQFPMRKSFVVAVGPSHCIVPPSWPDMETIINDAMSSPEREGPCVQSVIETLKDKITTGTPRTDAKGTVVQFFQDVLDQNVKTIPARLHSEILLATLGLAPREEITLGTNDECLQAVCDAIHQRPFSTSVSKPCCRVCQVFFQVLKNEDPTPELIMARCDHSNTFPVQLPVWTPPAIREKMEKIFLGYLRIELIDMVTPPSPPPLLASLYRHL